MKGVQHALLICHGLPEQHLSEVRAGTVSRVGRVRAVHSESPMQCDDRVSRVECITHKHSRESGASRCQPRLFPIGAWWLGRKSPRQKEGSRLATRVIIALYGIPGWQASGDMVKAIPHLLLCRIIILHLAGKVSRRCDGRRQRQPPSPPSRPRRPWVISICCIVIIHARRRCRRRRLIRREGGRAKIDSIHHKRTPDRGRPRSSVIAAIAHRWLLFAMGLPACLCPLP